MQCNFLGYIDRSCGSAYPYPDNCLAGPGEYVTTPEDQELYCKSKFRNCPRFETKLKMETLKH